MRDTTINQTNGKLRGKIEKARRVDLETRQSNAQSLGNFAAFCGLRACLSLSLSYALPSVFLPPRAFPHLIQLSGLPYLVDSFPPAGSRHPPYARRQPNLRAVIVSDDSRRKSRDGK